MPKARVDVLLQQLAKAGRAGHARDARRQIKDEVIAREIFMQEAQKRGLDGSDDYKAQMELARQTLLIRELFADYQKKNPVTDADIQAEYDKFAAANGGKEYRARHILVEKEDEAKKLIAEIKGGASSRTSPRSSPRTRARAPTAATSTGPRPTATCPSSRRP